MPFPFMFLPVLLAFAASQAYWIFAFRSWTRRHIPDPGRRGLVRAAALAVYVLLFAFNFGFFGRSEGTPVRLTLSEALLKAPFLWWAFSSMVGFLVAAPLGLVRRAARPLSPGRRAFLEHTATAVSAVPFIAGGYGLLYGRLNLETSNRPIRLARLPKALHGFRIAQLSDIHIGPFMTQAEIRRYVAIANALKPDLIALTGDFVTWDPATQRAVVEALSGLRAPHGIFGCLGNHELWSHTEDSIAALFTLAGIRMLRQQRVPIAAGSDSFNLMGVDYAGTRGYLRGRIDAVADLVRPETANILLSHNPDTFDRAAELGVDLSLAGHTHGGQVALEFISPEIAPSRIMTPYVSGWFEKPGSQLYVNRGIGTVGAPIRVGAPPEITVFELVRPV